MPTKFSTGSRSVRQSGRNQNDYGGKDLWKRWVLSPEWKVEGVIDGESKLVTVMRWHAQDEVNQEESEQNEVDVMKKGADSTGKVMHMWKSGWWFVMRKIQMVELGWQQMRNGFHLKTEQRSGCVGSQVGWLWELYRWVTGVYIQCVR